MTFITNGKKIIATEGNKGLIISVSDNKISISGNVEVSQEDVEKTWKKGISLDHIAEMSLLDEKIVKNRRCTVRTESDGFRVRLANGMILGC